MSGYFGGSGGGITIGTTTITGGADTQVLFNDAGFVGSDAGLTYVKGTDTLTTGVLVAGAGAVGAPSVYLSTDTTTGLYRSAANQLAVTISGAQAAVFAVDAGTRSLKLVEGASSALWYATGGFGTVSSDSVKFFAGGSGYVVALRSTPAFNLASSLHYGWTNGASADAAADTGLKRTAAGVVGVTDGSTGNGQLSLAASQRMASKTVTLTEAGGAETVITITNATTQTFGVDFWYTVTCTDGTDRATRKGYFTFVADNAAGTVTATKDATNETDDASILIATGGATLTYAIALDVATANTTKITFNIDSSLVVTAASITWTALLNGTGTIA